MVLVHGARSSGPAADFLDLGCTAAGHLVGLRRPGRQFYTYRLGLQQPYPMLNLASLI